MGQLTTFAIDTVDVSGDPATPKINYTPARSRDGVFEFRGAVVMEAPGTEGDLFPHSAPLVLTASVRPGKLADLVSGAQRVKRRVTAKFAFPIESAGALGTTIVDFINVDCTVSVPVDATELQIKNALKSVYDVFFFTSSGAGLSDMLVYGYEPY